MEATATSDARAPRASHIPPPPPPPAPTQSSSSSASPSPAAPPQICPLHRPPLPRRRHCHPTPRSRSGGHGPPPLHKYNPGEPLSIKVNSLTSIDTEIPYSYYSLPFCALPEGVKDSAENLGELLMGDRIESSPYPFRMYANESDVLLCRSPPLDAMSFSLLKRRIDEMYQVNLILNNLPAIRYTRKDDYFLRWTGYPIGIRVGVDYYVVELGRTDRDNRSEGAATFSQGRRCMPPLLDLLPATTPPALSPSPQPRTVRGVPSSMHFFSPMELRPNNSHRHGRSPHRWSSSRCTIDHQLHLPGTPLLRP